MLLPWILWRHVTVNPHIYQNLKVTATAKLDKPTIWKTSASALYYYHNQFIRIFSHHVGQASVSSEAETKLREWIYLGRANTLGDGRDSVDYLSPFHEISESPHLSNVKDLSIWNQFPIPKLQNLPIFSLDAYIFCYWVLVWASTVIFKKICVWVKIWRMNGIQMEVTACAKASKELKRQLAWTCKWGAQCRENRLRSAI